MQFDTALVALPKFSTVRDLQEIFSTQWAAVMTTSSFTKLPVQCAKEFCLIKTAGEFCAVEHTAPFTISARFSDDKRAVPALGLAAISHAWLAGGAPVRLHLYRVQILAFLLDWTAFSLSLSKFSAAIELSLIHI